MRPGTRIEVRSRFADHWSRGFEVSEVVNNDGRDRYKVRRRSDGSVLPVLFEDDDVREERRRPPIWW